MRVAFRHFACERHKSPRRNAEEAEGEQRSYFVQAQADREAAGWIQEGFHAARASDRKVESTFRINPMLTQEGWRVGRHGKPGPLFRPTHWLKAFSGEVDPVHRRRRFAGAAGPCAQL